tara:strand:- start:3142 stop:3558 length:417 start_codon:yes stop_codon:yes gene_type:complete
MKIGDKFRQVEQERYGYAYPDHAEDIFTVTEFDAESIYSVRGKSDRTDYEDLPEGIYFRLEEVEPVEDDAEPEVDERDEIIAKLTEKNLALRACVQDASWTFRYFADCHMNKNTPEATYKAMFNLMMADRLDDALGAD